MAVAAATPVVAASPFIDRANHEWERAIRTRDADALSRPYAEYAVFVLPDGRAVKGRQAIHDFYAARSATASAPVDARVYSAGRVAGGPDDVYEWGEAWTTIRSPDGALTRRGGRYLTVWHRGSGGHWSIIRNLAF